MYPRWTIPTVGLAVLFLGVVAMRTGKASQTAMPGSKDGPHPAEILPEDGLFEPTGMRADTQAGQVGAEGRGKEGAQTSSSEEDPREQWWAACPRSSIDLATLFLKAPAQVKATLLVRHEVLNRLDTRIDLTGMHEIESMISRNIDLLVPLNREFIKLRAKEMSDCVERGDIRPADLPRPTDAEIVRFAKGVAGPSGDVQKYIAYYLRHPPTAAMSHLSHVMIHGEVYLRRDFPALPQSAGKSQEIRYYAAQFLEEICSWFVVRGLASDDEVIEMVHRLCDMPL